MRSIKDDFKPVDGIPVFYTPVLRGPDWKRQGMPRVGPVDRQVWHYLRCVDIVKRPTVAEVARQVWHPDGNYRNSALSSLKRLKSLGLAEVDSKKLWFALIPDVKCAQISAHLTENQGAQISAKCAQISTKSAQISAGVGEERCAQISAPDVRRLAQVSAQISASMCADQRTIEKREEREEKLASTREDSEELDLEKLIGEEETFDLVAVMKTQPGIFKPDLPIPESLDGLDVYLTVAVKAEIQSRREKGKTIDKPGQYGSRIYDDYQANPAKAQESLKAAVKQIKAQRSRRSRESKQADQAKGNLPPSLPPRDEARDSLKVNLEDWLDDRFPSLSGQVRAARSTTAEDLEYLRIRADRLQERLDEMWESKGSRNGLHAEHVRKQYLQEIWIFTKDLKGVMA